MFDKARSRLVMEVAPAQALCLARPWRHHDLEMGYCSVTTEYGYRRSWQQVRKERPALTSQTHRSRTDMNRPMRPAPARLTLRRMQRTVGALLVIAQATREIAAARFSARRLRTASLS